MKLTGSLPPLVVVAGVLMATASLARAQGVDANSAFEILNRSCTSCHDMRPVQTQALDSEGWLEVINRMIENGAQLETIEQLILLDYLVRNHGPLPEGEGRELLLNRCTVCHNLERVRAHQGTPELWQDAVQTMLNEGAYLTDPEYAILVEYLSEHFGPGQDPP